MTQWKKMLRSLGLTESESTIYLLSLELGPTSVQDIARKALVSRMTTYTAIESLTEHGLMSSVQKGKKTLYTAESPERLVSFVHTKIRQVETTLHEVQGAIDELKLRQRGERPAVKLLEGLEGLKALMDDIIETAPTEALEYYNIESVYSTFSADELKPFRERLSELKVTGKGLFSGMPPANIPPRKHVEIRQIKQHHLPFNGDIFIYGNKVAMSTLRGKLITVIIESPEIADTLRSMYLLAWEASE